MRVRTLKRELRGKGPRRHGKPPKRKSRRKQNVIGAATKQIGRTKYSGNHGCRCAWPEASGSDDPTKLHGKEHGGRQGKERRRASTPSAKGNGKPPKTTPGPSGKQRPTGPAGGTLQSAPYGPARAPAGRGSADRSNDASPFCVIMESSRRARAITAPRPGPSGAC